MQTHGHSHHEEAFIIRSVDMSNFEIEQTNNPPVGMHYVTGSVTTFKNNYPTFRLFEMDEETLLPVKIQTYRFDFLEEN